MAAPDIENANYESESPNHIRKLKLAPPRLLMTIVKLLSAVPSALLARRVKAKLPVAVGVPLMVTIVPLELSESPVGKEPDRRLKVTLGLAGYRSIDAL